MTSNMPQWKADIAGRLCLVDEFYPSYNWGRLDIVGITDLPYSLKSSVQEGRGGGKQAKMTQNSRSSPFLHAVLNKEAVYDIFAGNL